MSVPGVGGEVSAARCRRRGVGGEVSAALALACRRWGLAVTCACVVRHCASVLAPPMGGIPSGGLHVIGRIAPVREELHVIRWG